jgi:hypothetical protein
VGYRAPAGFADMFGLSEQTRVFLKTGATDGRLGLDALRGLVSQALRQDALLCGRLEYVAADRKRTPRWLTAWKTRFSRRHIRFTGFRVD